MYNISVDDVKNAYQGLTETTFSRGKSIRIPVFNNSAGLSGNNKSNLKKEYKVQKGETLYSIGKLHNVSVEALLSANSFLKDGGLKDGMVIEIPEKQIENIKAVNTVQGQGNLKKFDAPYAYKGETVRIGILLPFLDDKGSIQKEKIVEYYEGFLLAVKALKEKGLNADIYAFDIGTEKTTKKLESLLGTNEMEGLHLIIGGVSKQQIDILSKFSKRTGIKYVVPFGSTNDIYSTPTLFQMTSSHSSLYPKAIAAFKGQFRNYNIIFVSEAGSNNDKSDFVNELKKDLTKSGIQFKTTASSSSLLTDIRKVADASKKNILVPTSSSEMTLRRVIAAINSMTTESVELFGYPEWQVYTQHTTSLHKYGAYIYSIFFLDEQQRQVQDFTNEYKRWYNKNLINSYPKYGFLGYDTGLSFLTALNNYGSSFDTNISNITPPTLQSAIYFEKVNNGGFVNNGLYLIHYKDGSGIEKIDVSK